VVIIHYGMYIMSCILYYSTFCENSKTVLRIISRWPAVVKDTHFINIDRRVRRPNGNTYIVLENSQEILLPPTVTSVPALLLLNKNNQVLFGGDITTYLERKENGGISVNPAPGQQMPMQQPAGQPVQRRPGQPQQAATQPAAEPSAFSFSDGYSGIVSDNFSYLDQSVSSLSAEGDGGMRQTRHYATLDFNGSIATPTDTYSPDKVGSVSLEQLQQKREADLQPLRQNGPYGR